MVYSGDSFCISTHTKSFPTKKVADLLAGFFHKTKGFNKHCVENVALSESLAVLLQYCAYRIAIVFSYHVAIKVPSSNINVKCLF